MDFGQAIAEVKCGLKVRRAGWNGKGMFIFQGLPRVEVNADKGGCVTSVDAAEHFGVLYSGPVLCMKTAQDNIVVGWLASQTDLLSDDWEWYPM